MAEKLDFDGLIQSSVAELQAKLDANMRNWGIHKAGRWDFDLEQGLLVFSFNDGIIADCAIQVVGSFSTLTKTWLWSWANASTPEAMREDALRVRAFGEQHQFNKLTRAKWPAGEEDAWAMTALAVHLCETQGAYRCPIDDVYLFVSIHSVKLHRAVD